MSCRVATGVERLSPGSSIASFDSDGANRRLFFTHSTDLADIYSRSVMRGVAWLAGICERVSFPAAFFSREDGIKRGAASLIRQMAMRLKVLNRADKMILRKSLWLYD